MTDNYDIDFWTNRIRFNTNDFDFKNAVFHEEDINKPELDAMGIDWAGPEGWGRIEFKKYVTYDENGERIDDGILYLDSEHMSKDFVKRVLCEMVDKAEMVL